MKNINAIDSIKYINLTKKDMLELINKTFPDEEVGKVIDELCEKVNAEWHVLMMHYLLKIIGDRWLDKI